MRVLTSKMKGSIMMASIGSFAGRSSRLTVFSLAVVTGGVMPVLAQDQDQLYNQMSNQLGILRYCVKQGFPSQKSASIYENFLASLPSPKNSEIAKINEQKGREGFYFIGEGSQMSVEQMAEGLNQTLEEHCKSFDENAKALGG